MSMAIALALAPLYVYVVAVLPARFIKRRMADGPMKRMLFREIS